MEESQSHSDPEEEMSFGEKNISEDGNSHSSYQSFVRGTVKLNLLILCQRQHLSLHSAELIV